MDDGFYPRRKNQEYPLNMKFFDPSVSPKAVKERKNLFVLLENEPQPSSW
jgi:hypothetical protein